MMVDVNQVCGGEQLSCVGRKAGNTVTQGLYK